MYNLELTIDRLPSMINIAYRQHYHARGKEINEWFELIRYYTVGKIPAKPLHRAHLKLVRYSSSPPDYDGLVGSFKHVLDALVKNRILEDDNWFVTEQWDVSWKLAKKKQGKIYIQVQGEEE